MEDLKEYIEGAISMYTSAVEASIEERKNLEEKLKNREEDDETDYEAELFYRVMGEEGVRGAISAYRNILAYIAIPKNAEAIN